MPDRSEWQKIGRRSRQKGKTRQRELRHMLENMFGIDSPEGVDLQKMGDEENWTHLPVRVELKAGDQVRTIRDRFLAAQIQWDGWRDDPRPFLFAIRPDGQRVPLLILTADDLVRVCNIYFEIWGGEAGDPDES